MEKKADSNVDGEPSIAICQTLSKDFTDFLKISAYDVVVHGPPPNEEHVVKHDFSHALPDVMSDKADNKPHLWAGIDTSTPTIDRAGAEGSKCDMTVGNKTPAAIKLFWSNRDGKLQLYATIPAGGSHSQQTYMHHIWLAADAATDAPLAFFEAMPQVLIHGQVPTRASATLELTWSDQWRGTKGHLHARKNGGAWEQISTDAVEHEATRESFEIPAWLLGGKLELGFSGFSNSDDFVKTDCGVLPPDIPVGSDGGPSPSAMFVYPPMITDAVLHQNRETVVKDYHVGRFSTCTVKYWW